MNDGSFVCTYKQYRGKPSPVSVSGGKRNLTLTMEHFPMHQIVVKDSGQVAEQRSSARWLEENTNWHAKVGKHVQSVSSELFVPEQRSPTALLGFTLEAAEMVTCWYMRHSSVEGGKKRGGSSIDGFVVGRKKSSDRGPPILQWNSHREALDCIMPLPD